MFEIFFQVGEVVITKDDTLFLKGKGNEKDITCKSQSNFPDISP